MAQPGNHIRFDQTPDTNFYMCRCRNHVLSGENYLFEDAGVGAVICENPVNVREEVVESDRRRHQRGNQRGRGNQSGNQRRVLNVSCNNCSARLGHRLVGPDDVAENMFVFFLKRLLYWNGNKVVYADTEETVENNLPGN